MRCSSRLRAILALASVIALAGTGAAETTPGRQLRRFTPVSKWAMEYADDSCRLIREFSDGRDSITLALERFVPLEPLAIGLTGSGIHARPNAREVRFAFAPASGILSGRIYRSELADRRPYLYILGTSTSPKPRRAPPTAREMAAVPLIPVGLMDAESRQEVEDTGRVEEVQLLDGFTEPVALVTGPLAAAMTAMQGCMDDLLTQWNVDPKAYRTLSRLPRPDMRRLIAAIDYPLGALSENRGGLIRYRMSIDMSGKPTACFILGPGGKTDLARETCHALMTAGRFLPALAADGTPVPGLFLGKINYVAP